MRTPAATLAIDGGRPVRAERLPLHKPSFDERERDAVRRVLDGGRVAGDGPCGHELEALIRQATGARAVLAVSSCTAALEIAMAVAGLGPGDEVIVPSFTFVSTANAVVRTGASVVFADIDARTWCIDPADVERRITTRTRAIVPVHYAGMSCEMPRLEALAERHGLAVIEDAAHAANAFDRGRALGTIGAMGALSFHETKDVVCGEGGALLVRDDDALARAAEIFREKGTDRSAFIRGEIDKYTWVGLGSSCVLSDVLAAIACEQVRKLPEITRRKTAQANRLLAGLAQYAGAVRLPHVPDGCQPNWHVFAVLVDPERRDWAIKALRAEGLGAAFHYVPLHSAPFARRSPLVRSADLPTTDRVAASLIRLPMSAAFTDEESAQVVEACRKVFDQL